LYDKKHRAPYLKPNWKGEYKRVKLLQKGMREKLLCDDCEQLLNNRYEKHFKEIWFDQMALPRVMPSNRNVIIRNLDYQKFKLFHLSILFRASVSSLPEFRNVSLGAHEELIRRIIIDDQHTPENEYIILCHAVTKPNSEIQYGLITSPFKLRQHGGYLSYGFCFGGCVWYYFVDKRKTSKFSSFMLNEEGELGVSNMAWETFINLQ